MLIACNFAFGPLRNLGVVLPESWLAARKALGMTGFLLVLIHALMSFLLFRPAFYQGFFAENGTLTLFAGLSMLAGVLAFVVLWAYNLSFQTFLREDKAFIFGGAHLLFMGFEGWMEPAGWHGGLPPVSLVAFTVFVAAYVINWFGRE